MTNLLFVNVPDSLNWMYDTGQPLKPGWYWRVQGDMFGPQPLSLHWTHFYLPYLQNCDTTWEGRCRINLTQGVMDYVN